MHKAGAVQAVAVELLPETAYSRFQMRMNNIPFVALRQHGRQTLADGRSRCCRPGPRNYKLLRREGSRHGHPTFFTLLRT